MVKCSKAEVRRLKTALRWKIPPALAQQHHLNALALFVCAAHDQP